MTLFSRDPIKQAAKLNELLKANTLKIEDNARILVNAAKAKIKENQGIVSRIEAESMGLFNTLRDMPEIPEEVKEPDQTVNKIFTPDEKVPTLKDNFKVIGHLGKRLVGRGNTILSDGLHKLTKNLQ